MKTVLITGGTDGIGKQTAFNIAKENNHVILVGRNKKKCEEVTQQIKKESKNSKVNYIVKDLSLISDNKSLASTVINKYPSLNILINNVGALFLKKTYTREGFEKTFALNHLGPFCLTNELLKLLKTNQHSRIINVSSAAHFNVISNSKTNDNYKRTIIESLFFTTYLDKADYQSNKTKYKGGHQYSRTKLMNILFTYRLANQLKGTDITVNCLHPGFVASKFGHNNKGFFKSFLKFGQSVKAISMKEGALTSTFLALSNEVNNVSGKYFDEDTKEIPSSSISNDKSLQNDLWQKSENYIKSVTP